MCINICLYHTYVCMHTISLHSCPHLMTLWTVAHEALLSMGFSRQGYWSGFSCPPPGDLPDPGIEPKSLMSPALADRFFTTSATQEAQVLAAQSCLTLCNPMICNLPGSSVYGILQERILKWVAIPFSRGSSWPRDQTWVSCIVGRFFTAWATVYA